MSSPICKYKEGKIYKLVGSGTEKIYIGSTCASLYTRLAQHKHSFESKKTTKCRACELYEHQPVSIVLIESYPCETKKELELREQFWIKELACINKNIPGRTGEEYRKNHKEKIDQKNAQRRADPEKRKHDVEQQKKRLENPEKKLKQQEYEKQYKKENAERIKLNKQTKYICECGVETTKGNKWRHDKVCEK
jgi:hypothetical protein